MSGAAERLDATAGAAGAGGPVAEGVGAAGGPVADGLEGIRDSYVCFQLGLERPDKQTSIFRSDQQCRIKCGAMQNQIHFGVQSWAV